MASVEKFLQTAKAEIGTKETGINNVKYNTWYYGYEVDGDKYAWCAAFVSWCAKKAGVSEKTIPKTASAGYFAAYAKQGHGEVFTNKSPEPGDLFLIGYDGNDYANHVGIVWESDEGGSIKTIEGNSSNQVLTRTMSTRGLTFVRFNLTGQKGMKAVWTAKEVPNIGRDLATKAYMAYQSYTNSEAAGYDLLWGSDSKTASEGLRKYKDFYCVAMGSYYGPDGTYLKIEFDDGKTIYCVKADEKKDSETDARHQYHDYPFDRNVLEFIVDSIYVQGNDDFTAALKAEGIDRSARITAIYASEEESTSSSTYGGDERVYNFADTNEKISLHPTLFNQPEMVLDEKKEGFKLIINEIDESNCACNISFDNTLKTLATSFSFSIPKTGDMKHINIYEPKEGDIVRYSGGAVEDFRGVITEVDDGDRYKNSYIAVDAGQYLAKTKDTYQFDAMRADDCIKKICGDLSVPIVELPILDTPITEIYIEKTVAEVIEDILSSADSNLNFDFVPSGLRVYKSLDKVAEPKFRISSNTEKKDSIHHIGNISHKKSISDIKTVVKIVSETDVLLSMKNNDEVSMYGFLQEVIKIDDEETALDRATEYLDENGNAKETFSGEIIEEMTSYTRAGYVVVMGEVKYLITSSKHTIENGMHKVKLDFERV